MVEEGGGGLQSMASMQSIAEEYDQNDFDGMSTGQDDTDGVQDEIDSSSDDKTVEICNKYGCQIKIIDRSYLFEFEIVKKERVNLIEKASVCVNGISLTISKLTKKGFQLWVIPHTFKLANLSTLKKNSTVNIEIDILSKYVRNYFNEKK